MKYVGVLCMLCVAALACGQSWLGFAKDSQHSALSAAPAQPLERILWSTPVDLQPQYSGSSLLIHYGSPLITPNNTVIVTVKTGMSDFFRVEGHRSNDGSLIWSEDTNYSVPSAGWTPSCGSTLTPSGRLYTPGGGGTVLMRTNPDTPSGSVTRIAFYGIATYNQNQTIFNSNVKINTPITTDTNNNVYFGFIVLGSNPAGLTSGIARINASGTGTWTPVTTAANDPSMQRVPINCAPALSNDETILYIAIRDSNGRGYLVGLNSITLAPVYRVRLTDPVSGSDALMSDLGTSSPTVGPDGDVYYGVLENNSNNHYRGYMLHFDSTLTQTKIPGAFGWDVTSSIVPSSAVPSYNGTSAYLILTKYNNYLEGGGDGNNKVAILDPNASMIDPISGGTMMREVLTVSGVTHDPRGGPEAVKEWCINTAAIDPVTKSAIVNNEDGVCYRWDFTTNTLSQNVRITDGLGEAYTPTVIGPDGTVYAINNAILFAIGSSRIPPDGFTLDRGLVLSSALAQLLASDDSYLILRPGIVLSSSEEPVQLVVIGTARGATASSLKFDLESSVNQANLSQRIYLFDYVANGYVLLDTRPATLADSVVEVTATNPQNFLEPSTNRVKAKITYKASGPLLTYPWQAKIDQVYWKILP